MKVICIDGKCSNPLGYELNEGEEYEVYQSDVHPRSYRVIGYLYAKNGQPCAYSKSRFIPLSTIDEMELLHNRQTELA